MVIPAGKVTANIGTLLLAYSLALAREVNLFFFLSPLVMEKEEKIVLTQKKMISISERRAVYPLVEIHNSSAS